VVSALGFLARAAHTDAAEPVLAKSRDELGYEMNASWLWAHLPEAYSRLFELLDLTVQRAGLSFRERGTLVTACAGALHDSYCSLAWGRRLAAVADPALAAAVVAGDDGVLDARERALASWARAVAGRPNSTVPEDVAPLRAAGFDDGQIFAITVFVAGRIAYATVNEALGALPDARLVDDTPAAVVDAVRWGRPPAPRPDAPIPGRPGPCC